MTAEEVGTAPQWKQDLGKMIARNLPGLTGLAYRIRLEGIEEMDKDSPALIAFKHQGMADFLISAYVLNAIGKQATLIVKKKLFESDLARIVLTEWGAEPITRPQDDGYKKQSARNLASVKKLYWVLGSGGWYVFAPESTRVRGRVGDELFMHPVLVAARMHAPIYFMSAEYTPQRWLNWLPLLLPFVTRVVVRAVPYDAAGKNLEQIAADFRTTVTKLSGFKPGRYQ